LFAPAIGDDTADEEDCLLEEEAVGGALILSCETSELSIRMCVEGDRGERDKRERERAQGKSSRLFSSRSTNEGGKKWFQNF
jgi:hypothetical protein